MPPHVPPPPFPEPPDGLEPTDGAPAERDAADGRADAALERRLAEEGLLPLPMALVTSILAAVRAAPRCAWEREGAAGLALPRGVRSAAAALLVAAGGWLTLAGIEPVAAAAETVAAASPAPTLAGPRPAAPLALTRGPVVDARAAAASLADEAASLPGGPTGLVGAGVGLLAVSLVTARRVARGRTSRPAHAGGTDR